MNEDDTASYTGLSSTDARTSVDAWSAMLEFTVTVEGSYGANLEAVAVCWLGSIFFLTYYFFLPILLRFIFSTAFDPSGKTT